MKKTAYFTTTLDDPSVILRLKEGLQLSTGSVSNSVISHYVTFCMFYHFIGIFL